MPTMRGSAACVIVRVRFVDIVSQPVPSIAAGCALDHTARTARWMRFLLR